MLTQTEAAKYLNRSLRTLALWREKGYGHPDAPIAGIWRAYTQQPSKGRGKTGMRRGRAYMHRTDLSIGKNVAILALRKLGSTVDQAAGGSGLG